MCAAVSAVPAGNPLKLATKSTVAETGAPVESLVTFTVTVTLPEPVLSAPTIAGTSFAGDSWAVYVVLVAVVAVLPEVGAVLVVQPVPRATTRTTRASVRVMDLFRLLENQKNLRDRLKTRYSVFAGPPRAI